MKKKVIIVCLFILAMAASMILLSSCNKEKIEPIQSTNVVDIKVVPEGDFSTSYKVLVHGTENGDDWYGGPFGMYPLIECPYFFYQSSEYFEFNDVDTSAAHFNIEIWSSHYTSNSSNNDAIWKIYINGELEEVVYNYYFKFEDIF